MNKTPKIARLMKREPKLKEVDAGQKRRTSSVVLHGSAQGSTLADETTGHDSSCLPSIQLRPDFNHFTSSSLLIILRDNFRSA